MPMWFTVEQEKPDIGTVIFKADDYYERLQHITGMWNDNKFLYYEMLHSSGESSEVLEFAEEKRGAEDTKIFTVADITDVPELLAYLEKANLNGTLAKETVDFMWELHQLYVKKMSEYGQAIHHLSKKEYNILENREKWARLVKLVEERQRKLREVEEEDKRRKRRLLKPLNIKSYYMVDSPSVNSHPHKRKGRAGSKFKTPKMTQWQLFMKDKMKHPSSWDFGQTVLYSRLDIRKPGKHLEFTRFYYKLERSLRFAKREPVDWRTITLEEVDKHRYKNDCWMAIKGRVYDVTDYLYKHPGGADFIMQGAGVDATWLYVIIHPYVVFYEKLMGKQIGTLPDFKEHFHTQWEYPGNFDIFRSIKEWFFRPRNPLAKYQPKVDFKQTKDHYLYTVRFPKDSISREEDWSITIINGFQVTVLKHVEGQYVWYGGFDLRNRVMDDTAYRVFSDNFSTLQLEIKKPYKVSIFRPIRDKRQDDRFFLSSYTLKDMCRATLVERRPVAHGVNLYGVCVGMNKLVGCPIGWYVNLRLRGETRPYTPVCLPDEFEKKYKQKSDSFQTLFFLIKEFKNGRFTSMLHQMPTDSLVKGIYMYMSPAMGNFQLNFLTSNMDVMLLIAGGTGISVMTRIIQEYILHPETVEGKHVILLFFVQRRGDLIWRDVWRRLSRQYKWFHYYHSLTRVYRYSIDEDDSKSDPNKPGSNKEKQKANKSLENEAANQIRQGTVLVADARNPDELFGYPASSKLEYIYGRTDGANKATDHKAIVCGPYGFNHSCELMLKAFGKHEDYNTYYFAG